ncbi:hypothetical protein K504DRAFT_262151 [Pleomassaria siparia CBS 279.74]|uniref:Zn(2)-C6 fungal-type domain-containing protein n=1 Tax=Pleomassaria siparia CBS 279.74 TaxID=1314801 RepID=A0A6G1KC99_9PLEO|nr:hypothetical protein K504DRAFT_262151 [Pleomassaria siparia CBS 279.74]
MPNVGRPSKGCKNCRDRKVKCDQKCPSCSQCLRTHRECYGYRDPLSLMFKNETNVVARKAKTRYEELSKQETSKSVGRKRSKVSSGDSTSSETLPSTPGSDQQVAINRHYSHPDVSKLRWEGVPSIEDDAIGFFLASYVITPTFVPRGQFDFLPEMLSGPNTEEILQRSVRAASLAALAMANKSLQLFKKAQQEYVSALALTNKALRSKQDVTRDSTLVSVILLGMYENFTHQSKDSLQQWVKHVQGACTLICLRGKSQFSGSIGTRVFQQFYGTALLVAMENGSQVPAGLSDMWELGTRLNDYSVPGKVWTTRLVRFMHNAINISGDKTSDPVAMVNTAIHLDRDLDEIGAFMPNIWKYETVYIEEPAEYVYGNSYHVYLDPWLAQMWNNLRAVRLILHKILRSELLKGLASCPPLFERSVAEAQIRASEQVIRSTSADICASTPQITGQIPFPDPLNARPSIEALFSDHFDPKDPRFKLHPPGTFWNPFRPTGLHNLIWPVYSLAECCMCPKDLREWAIQQLHFVALKIGARQAVVMANELKELQTLGSVEEIEARYRL